MTKTPQPETAPVSQSNDGRITAQNAKFESVDSNTYGLASQEVVKAKT